MDKTLTTKNLNAPDDLIAGYFAEQLSDADVIALRDWLLQSSENQNYFRQMQEVWLSAIGADEEMCFDKEMAFRRFLNRVETATENERITHHKRLHFWQAAAVAAIVVVSAAAFFVGVNSQNKLLATISVEAPYGSRTKLFLPDSTLVWLNAGSIIRYAQNFGIKNRNVSVSGEAYFEVTKDTQKPFNVQSGDIRVQVLGTKFNLRNYDTEANTSVTLVEGKVNVKQTGSEAEYVLLPDKQAIFDKHTHQMNIAVVKAQYSSAWTKGIIFFDEELLGNIARQLERTYNVQITIADRELNDIRFYGDFYRTEQTIEEVMKILSLTNKFSYSVHDKKVVIWKKEKDK
jgi:ferric-dicitrate binding protein FerR (iron transport regulator)